MLGGIIWSLASEKTSGNAVPLISLGHSTVRTTPTNPNDGNVVQSNSTVHIEFSGVHKWFGDFRVLRDINFRVFGGEIVVICGPSGSGKSTFIRCVNQLEKVQQGEIYVLGERVSGDGVDLTRLRTQVGIVFQGFNLYPHKTALQNITLAPIKVNRLSKREAIDLAMALLDRVGLRSKANAYPSHMSGGEQQRVAIARALAMRPKIMLFDEPTSALDPEMIHEVLAVMAKLANDGITMLVVTHEMGFASKVAHRVVFMDDSEIVEDTTPSKFFKNPSSERGREFLSKILVHV